MWSIRSCLTDTATPSCAAAETGQDLADNDGAVDLEPGRAVWPVLPSFSPYSAWMTPRRAENAHRKLYEEQYALF